MHEPPATPTPKNYALAILISVLASALAFLSLVNIQQLNDQMETASNLNYLATLIPVFVFTMLQVYARVEQKRLFYGAFLSYLGFIGVVDSYLNNILSFHAHATPDFPYAFPIACINLLPATIYAIYILIRLPQEQRMNQQWYEAQKKREEDRSR